MNKIGRNNPCPCGSGKKYKKCCATADVTPLPAGTYNKQNSFTQADRASAISKLLRFASMKEFEMDQELGITLFWGGRLAERSEEEIKSVKALGEQFEINFNTWFLFDMEVEDGNAVADIFLKREKSRLNPGELTYLTKAQQTHFRLYEVEQVDLNKGFLLNDLWTGESHRVQEKSATHFLVQWDLLAARLMNIEDGIWEIDGGIYNFHPGTKTSLLKELRSEYKQFQRHLPGNDDVAFFKRIGMMFNHWWLDWVVFRPMPQFVTFEGDTILLTKVIFTVGEPTQLANILEQHPNMKRLKDGQYSWTEATHDGYRPLATLTILKNRLIIESISEVRAERCKNLIEDIAGDIITYHVSEYQEPGQAIKSHHDKGQHKHKEKEIPEELQAALMKTFLDKHYREWLDQELPALSHKTPRNAVNLKTFRTKVIDLLKEMENNEARAVRQGKIPYDFGWLWLELRLEK